MSTKSIRSIIFLMSISLVGLISFQAYWISNRMKKAEEEFDRDIQQLLTDVSDEIVQKEAIFFVKNFNLEENQFSKRDEILQFDVNDKGIKIIVERDSEVSVFPEIDEDETVIIDSDNGNTTVIKTTSVVSSDSSAKSIITRATTSSSSGSGSGSKTEVIQD